MVMAAGAHRHAPCREANAVLTVGAVVLGWTVLWVFFRFVGSPLTQFDQYLLENGLIDRYSVAWWLRSVLMWIVVGFPFLASGWMVAKVAARNALFPVFTFALSVSAAILVALVLDTRQADPARLGMWLTPVPLFLMVAPATAIAAGGWVGARR